MVNELRASYSLDDVYIPVNTSEIGFNRQNLPCRSLIRTCSAAKDIQGKFPRST